MNDYDSIVSIHERIPADRQRAKRHYGVHPYFTRRPSNVVRKYILNYSRERDVVLDPFGGSGITAIEAYLENRCGIQNDINPLANFISDGIAGLIHGSIADYKMDLASLQKSCKLKLMELESLEDAAIGNGSLNIQLPDNVPLPKTSDVSNYLDLFTRRQLYSLAIIRQGIDQLDDTPGKPAMLLAWSAALSKLNRTFLSAKGRAESRGGSSIFSIYRYKVASEPVELPAWRIFWERASNVIAAKKEIDHIVQLKTRTSGWRGTYISYSKDVFDLADEMKESVDYIFTDPPYGGHISYLDLSTLWNQWLGKSPNQFVRSKEMIVGGELNLREEEYVKRLGESITACVSMLKPNRWLSVVFQHWNIGYFEAILESAMDAGAELKAAITQVGDPVWSMHKKKNRESVLSGELILTFHKSGKRAEKLRNGHFNVEKAVDRILADTTSNKFYGEHLFNKLIIEAWKRGAIRSLDFGRDEFTKMLTERGWHYDKTRHYWTQSLEKTASLFD